MKKRKVRVHSKALLLLFVFKSKHNLVPNSLQHLYTTNDKVHGYSTRQASNYHLLIVNTNIRKQSPSFRGAKLWNELPVTLKEISSLNHFKNKLKQQFLGTYF